jgi:hypothetical protein
MKEIQEALVWTTEPPTEPGWYWAKAKGGATWTFHFNGEEFWHGDVTHFAGPIPEPQEYGFMNIETNDLVPPGEIWVKYRDGRIQKFTNIGDPAPQEEPTV